MRPLVVLALGAAACGTTEEPVSTGDTFLAFSSSFADFRSWTSFHSDGPAPGTQPDDILGPRTNYINEQPPHGATEFPVGTIVIEAMENGSGHIVAAAKRGGGYNGGRNWEYFELQENPIAIIWRGVGPPNGESYGGDPDGCNSCHEGCGAGNDLRCSPTLQLTGF
jgi:hypothetical protein